MATFLGPIHIFKIKCPICSVFVMMEWKLNVIILIHSVHRLERLWWRVEMPKNLVLGTASLTIVPQMLQRTSFYRNIYKKKVLQTIKSENGIWVFVPGVICRPGLSFNLKNKKTAKRPYKENFRLNTLTLIKLFRRRGFERSYGSLGAAMSYNTWESGSPDYCGLEKRTFMGIDYWNLTTLESGEYLDKRINVTDKQNNIYLTDDTG